MSELVKRLRECSDDWPAYLTKLDREAADALEAQAKRIKELEAEVHYLTNAGTIECMVRNKAVAEYIGNLEARLQSHSANTAGGPTPVMDAAPACEPERSVSESIAAGHPCFDPDGPPDHDWEYVDDSFSHEFGTEICGHYECARCNAIKPE